MAELIIGKEGKPSVYETLFATINAGPPADPAKAAAELGDFRTRELERIKAERGTDRLTPEEQEELQKKLARFRIGLYQRRANEISCYAGLDAVRGVIPTGGIPSVPWEDYECLVYQWDYWTVADLVRAVGEANREGSAFMPLERSVVKRIVSIELEPLPIWGDKPLSREEWTPPAGASDQAPLDPSYSITGRRSSKLNKLYDVRHADLTVIVDSSRLTDLVNAISRTNFMTVIGCKLSEVDAWKDLDEGYYYGPAHVVRAALKVETIWLRSWTVPLMPEEIKIKLGVVEAPAGEVEAPPTRSPGPGPRGRATEEDLGVRRGLGPRGGG
jgi:hypothetical protein